MKALKRTMAGEYSRELGVKILEGQKRLVRLGFKQGGTPGYGLRRMLVSAERTPKQPLANGEHKSIATDRVILVPGPADEVSCVRDIYRMLVLERMPAHAIAIELNRRGIKYTGRSKWDYIAVCNILSHPKYMGCNAFGRTSQRLCTRVVRIPQSEWTISPGAFAPLVDEQTFREAQRILENHTIRKSNERLLDDLRNLLATVGRLSGSIIDKCRDVASTSAYRHRFGSLQYAYSLIGYGRPEQFGPNELRRRTQAMRDQLVQQIATLFPGKVSVCQRGGRWRPRLKLRNRLTVSVLVVRFSKLPNRKPYWVVQPVPHECKFVTLVARKHSEHCISRLPCAPINSDTKKIGDQIRRSLAEGRRAPRRFVAILRSCRKNSSSQKVPRNFHS